MNTQHSNVPDIIRREAKHFTFPAELQFNEYREPARQAQVVQVYFRYHPFSDVNEKFAFEMSFTCGR